MADSQNSLKTVNAIWVDDDPMVTDLQCQLLFPLIIDVYRTPAELMSRVEPNCIYSKNTPIFLDYNFDNASNTALGSNGTANRLKTYPLFLMAATAHALPHLA